jgi:hypothetical protein
VSPALSKLPGLGFLDRVSDVQVDAAGVTARAPREVVLDMLVDGRRVYSFWLHRDGSRVGNRTANRWRVAWPKTLDEFLDGTARFTVVAHESGETVFDGEVTLGSGRGRIEILNRNGQPLSLDKGWRRVVTFDTRSAANIEPLMKAIEVVLAALREVGIEAFLAYGTLLGAVREGKLIGHDSDADLGYVSRLSHPVDVIRESFRLQRDLVDLGFHITRYSALAFKVDVDEGDGVVRGLDVFGGFLMDGNLHLMGEIREPFDRPPRCAASTAGSVGSGSAAPSGTASTRAGRSRWPPIRRHWWPGPPSASPAPRRTSTSAAAGAPTCCGWRAAEYLLSGSTSSRAPSATPPRRSCRTPSSGAATCSSCATYCPPARR